MKIIISKPPIYEECEKIFEFHKGIVFTYGDNIFNPDGVIIPDHLLVHESTHADQQKHDDTVAKLWWQRYIIDTKFRLEQEVEAYKNQYEFICKKIKDRNIRFRFLHLIACDLCSKMYGGICSYTDAIRLIKEK